MVRSFHSFSVKLAVKRAFLAYGLWLKEQSLYMSSALVFAHGFKTLTDSDYIALENCKKNAICFKLFWYKVFVHWKLKLLNFPILIIFHKVDESGSSPDPFSEETPGGSILVSHYLQ